VPKTEPNCLIRFGVFEVDPRTGELRSKGSRVKLQDQPLQILLALLEKSGEVVTREELRAKLWPADTFVDFDHGLNAAVKRLRDALGESAEKPIFIETLARRGYRFIAPVDGGFAPSGIGVAAAPEKSKSSFFRSWIAVAALLSTTVIAVLVWALWQNSSPRQEAVERRLTANSFENSVSSGAASRDGAYVAYADYTGIYLKLIRTGETHPVPLPPNFAARVDDWFPDDSHLLVSRLEQPGKTSLWSISVFGGAPRQLADDASGGALSPDGSHIAFHRGDLTWGDVWGREEWVMRSDGTDVVKVAAARSDDSKVGTPTWSPDGKRIAYVRTNFAYHAPSSSIELNEWQKASAQTLFSDGRLTPALHWLRDGRLIYALSEGRDSGLWMVSLEQSRTISEPPKRMTRGPGWILHVSGSTDGKVVTFLRGSFSPSVYIGKLTARASHLLANKRLTLDENENSPYAWTPDSKAVLFTSDRNGTFEIFRQSIDQPLPEGLVSSAEQLSQPRLTPDGSEIVYISTPKSASPETPSSIFAIPIGGGTPRLVLKDFKIWNVQCARLPSTLCLYSITKGNTAETFRFDPRNGKRAAPPEIDPDCNWSLSPDGSQRAIIDLVPNQGKIRLRATSTGEARDLIVKGWNGFQNIDWSADGKSLLVAIPGSDNRDSVLLNVTLDGRASVLLHSGNPWIGYAIPSPDRRSLAIAEFTATSNVWQLENLW
jgi:DNA-binding winged helix-turn-helix (wHTH) protein/Tol biopolymer transport system component